MYAYAVSTSSNKLLGHFHDLVFELANSLSSVCTDTSKMPANVSKQSSVVNIFPGINEAHHGVPGEFIKTYS